MGSQGERLLYHEKQKAALCGVHCLNTLLQGPYFTEFDLAHIATELDAMERHVMSEGGVDGADYLKFMAEESGNVAADGMFSIQVLSKALEVWDLSCMNLDSPDLADARLAPEREQAFICNLQEHWFTIRQVQGQWWNFNSLFTAPQPLGQVYLSAFLGTLREQDYNIFVTRGVLPQEHPDAGVDDSGAGQWVTPQEARQAFEFSQQAKQSGYLKAAMTGSGQAAPAPPNPWAGKGRSLRGDSAPAASTEDDDMAAAIAASLADQGVTGDGGEGPSGTSGRPESSAVGALREESSSAAESSEPPAGPGVVEVALRLPGGQRLMRRFRLEDTVQDVEAFLLSKGIDPDTHLLAKQFPRKALSERKQTLQEVGIGDKEALLVERSAKRQRDDL